MALHRPSPHSKTRTSAERAARRSIFSRWRLTGRRLTAVFGPPLLVAIVGIIAHNRTAKIVSTRLDYRRSRAVADAADKLVTYLVDAETGQRGFLLTNNEEYLRPYLRSVDSVPLALARLRAAVDTATTSATTRFEVDSLAYFSSARMAEIAETLQLQRAIGADTALAIVKTNRGRDAMRAARRIADTIRNQESSSFASRSADLTRYTNEVTWVVLIGTGVAFLIALLVNVLLVRDAAMQAQLAAERDGALAALTASNAELQSTSEELRHQSALAEKLLEGEQQARRDAEAANAAKTIFLTTMSHELRTPLNAIAGYADLLEMGVRGPITELQREDLRRIRRASQHLLSLINDILNYARLDAGSVELHLSEITIDDALGGMEALIAPQLQAKGVGYEYRRCDRNLRVHADREKLDQILLNLVGNAVKFTQRDGHVTLSCVQDGNEVRVIVKDTGRGIPRAKLQSIFDPFVQVDRHLTPERHQGVGLGLAISRDLARAMHGDISVQSDSGQGATFVLTLPLYVPDAPLLHPLEEVERV